jgi:hypothetical protein
MAATSWNPKQPRIRATAGGGIPDIRTFAEAASQSYKAGALVYFHASTGLVTALADGGAVIGGIVQEDASTTASTAAHVQIFKPGDEILMICYDESDTAEVSSSTYVPGMTYDTEIDANGVAYAEHDTENATNVQWIFISPVLDSTGTATNWGVFQLELHANQMAGAKA